jgi:hypothetical protein
MIPAARSAMALAQMLVRHSVLAQAIPVDANSPMRGQCILYLQGNPGFATFPVTALRPSRRHIRCATKKRLEEYGADRIWPCRPYLIPQARTSGPRPRNAIRLFLGWGSEYESSSCGANMSIKMFVVGCRGIPLVNAAPSGKSASAAWFHIFIQHAIAGLPIPTRCSQARSIGTG